MSSIALYEIEPGIWIVPELVTAVMLSNPMGQPFVTLQMVGGGLVQLRESCNADQMRTVVAWIDARRLEPLIVIPK